MSRTTELKHLIDRYGWTEITNNLKWLKELEPNEIKIRKLANLKAELELLIQGCILSNESTICGWTSGTRRIESMIDEIKEGGLKTLSKDDKERIRILNDELEQFKNQIIMLQHGIDGYNEAIRNMKSFNGDLDEFQKEFLVQLGKFRSSWQITKKNLFPFRISTEIDELLLETTNQTV